MWKEGRWLLLGKEKRGSYRIKKQKKDEKQIMKGDGTPQSIITYYASKFPFQTYQK